MISWVGSTQKSVYLLKTQRTRTCSPQNQDDHVEWKTVLVAIRVRTKSQDLWVLFPSVSSNTQQRRSSGESDLEKLEQVHQSQQEAGAMYVNRQNNEASERLQDKCEAFPPTPLLHPQPCSQTIPLPSLSPAGSVSSHLDRTLESSLEKMSGSKVTDSTLQGLRESWRRKRNMDYSKMVCLERGRELRSREFLM